MQDLDLSGENPSSIDINEIMIEFLNIQVKKIKKTIKKDFESKNNEVDQIFEIKLTEALIFPSFLRNQIVSPFRKSFNSLIENFRPQDYTVRNLSSESALISLLNKQYLVYNFFIIELYRSLGLKIEEKLKESLNYKGTIYKELSSLGITVFTEPTSFDKNDITYFVEDELESILSQFMLTFLNYLIEIQKGEKDIFSYKYILENKYHGVLFEFNSGTYVNSGVFTQKYNHFINDKISEKSFIQESMKPIYEEFAKRTFDNLRNNEYGSLETYITYYFHNKFMNLFNKILEKQGHLFFKVNSKNPIIKTEYKEHNTLFKDFGSFSKEDIKELMLIFSTIPQYRRREEILEIFE